MSMREKDVIVKTEKPIEKDDFIQAFKMLNLHSTDNVIVHTSMSKLGYIVGGPVTIIEALTSYFQDGLIMMPTQTGDNSNPAQWEHPPVPKAWVQPLKENMPAFDKDLTPTRGMGRVVEVFRTMKDVYRSDHPIVSFAAWGKGAKQLVENHPLSPAFGKDSPLDKFHQLKGKILCIGTDYDTITYLHYPETLCQTAPTEEQQTSMYVDGERQWVTYMDYPLNVIDFKELGTAFESVNKVKKTTIGYGHMQVIECETLFSFALNYMKESKCYE